MDIIVLMSGILIPLAGTSLGATVVFLLKDQLNPKLQKTLLGFAAGVMVAASVFSLLIPAIEMSSNMGKAACIPAVVGILGGFAFLLVMDKLIPHLHIGSDKPEGLKSKLHKNTMLIFAVTLHNLPEGMVAGCIFAGVMTGQESISLAGAFALSIGIALQNFPEGAIISLPLSANGMKKGKAFLMGTLSGVIEPIAAVGMLFLANAVQPLLPYLLAFAAGAMLYVVVEELIPESNSEEGHTDIATVGFAVGFVLMMVLDTVLG